jgi:hypothetical protein
MQNNSTLPGVDVTISDDVATVTLGQFGIDAFPMFLRCKAVPEKTLGYDWRTDTYTVTMPARFAAMLGETPPATAVAPLPIADHLFDYQRFVLGRALDARRYAAWLETGLGKAIIDLEWARQVVHLTGGRVLYFVPTVELIRQVAAQATQFYGDAFALTPLRSREAVVRWCCEPGPGAAVATYHVMVAGLMPELRRLGGIVADESSILKTGGGTIKWNLIHSAKGLAYKLSSTATPAPNETMEYASQASFLEKLRTEGEILWTYFTRDKYGNWSVKPHAREEFYRFMASWSIYMRDPAAFGFADILSSLPPPEIKEYTIDMTPEQATRRMEYLVQGGKGMFNDRLGVRERSKLSQLAKGFLYDKGEASRTATRVPSNKPSFVADLARAEVDAGRQALIWTVFDEESDILSDLLADAPFTAATLHGSMADDARADALDRFRTGEVRVLISKAQLLGYGLNLQFCRSMIFSGWDDSFERLYQAIRRCYRFGQTETVYVHIPYIAELEGMMLNNVKAKEAHFNQDVAVQELYYRQALGLGEERAR